MNTLVTNNNRNVLILQDARSSCKLKLEGNFFREDSQSKKHSQKPEMISCRERESKKKGLIK